MRDDVFCGLVGRIRQRVGARAASEGGLCAADQRCRHNDEGTMRHARVALAGALAALLLGGCMIGPDYVRPQVDVPAAYKEGALSTSSPAAATAVAAAVATEAAGGDAASSAWTHATPADAAARGPWWTRFGDAQLAALESRVDVSNLTVQKAAAQWREARAMVASAHADWFPTIGASTAASNLHDSANVIGHQQTAGKTFQDYAVVADATWEPDLWGRVAHENDAARANEQASAADLESVRLAMQSELAVDYFNLRTLDATQRLLDQTLADYRQALDLTTSRYRIGISSQADVEQARTQLQATQAQDLDLGVARAQYEHAIATLIGQPASTFTLPPAAADFTPPAIPPGVPSQLLERRPDIAAAERRVAAANDEIGIAESAFFPNLVLSAAGGLESSALSNWLMAPSRVWSLGPALAGTLFDGGRRRAETDRAKAQYDASVADYRQTVLAAFQQVEDNLAALRILQQETTQQDAAVQSADKTLQLELEQYRVGTVNYLDVVVAQNTALTNERAAVDLRRREMDASVDLVKALGGIW